MVAGYGTTIETGVSTGKYVRHMHFRKRGDIHPGHTHHFDHDHVVRQGAVAIQKTSPDGTAIWLIAQAGDRVFIDAHCRHLMMALEDDTQGDCEFLLRDENGEITSVYDGNMERYS